jgi:hypothetical protein
MPPAKYRMGLLLFGSQGSAKHPRIMRMRMTQHASVGSKLQPPTAITGTIYFAPVSQRVYYDSLILRDGYD